MIESPPGGATGRKEILMKYAVVKMMIEEARGKGLPDYSVEFFATLEGAKMYAEQFRGNRFLESVIIYEATEY